MPKTNDAAVIAFIARKTGIDGAMLAIAGEVHVAEIEKAAEVTA